MVQVGNARFATNHNGEPQYLLFPSWRFIAFQQYVFYHSPTWHLRQRIEGQGLCQKPERFEGH
jgi:hypothetical protein